MEATIGRVVLYVLPEGNRRGEVRPALVTRVESESDKAAAAGLETEAQREAAARAMARISLTVHTERHDGLPAFLSLSGVEQDQEGHAPGTWHWMEHQLREDAEKAGRAR